METAKTDTEKRLRHTVVAFDEFLPEPDVERLYAGALACEHDFVASFTTDDNPPIRRSLVLNAPPALVAPVVDRVQAVLPQVLAAISSRATIRSSSSGRVRCTR